MYKTTIRINARCPRHRRYNPELTGPGGIKAGCQNCWALYQLFDAARRTEALLRQFNQASEKEKI